MPRVNQGEDVRPVGVEIGDDGDTPGISQELTTDDVDDIAFDTHMSVGQRRRQLMGLLEEVRSRQSADFTGDMDEISAYLRDRIASLRNPLERQSPAEAAGMDLDGRSDTDAPNNDRDDGGIPGEAGS